MYILGTVSRYFLSTDLFRNYDMQISKKKKKYFLLVKINVGLNATAHVQKSARVQLPQTGIQIEAASSSCDSVHKTH